jgi:hypothetical protein
MRWLVVVLLGAGCFAPSPPEGAPCGEGLRPCPTGQMCNPADNRCYFDPQPGLDANGDGAIDAPPGTCVARRLLTAGMTVEAQGWTVERVGQGTISYAGGAITLTTTQNARQLIVLRDAFPSDRWSLRIVGDITQSGGCTPNNAAATVMAGFHDPIGDAADRARMLCMTPTTASWGDGSVSIGVGLGANATIQLDRTSSGGIRATILSGAGMGSMSGGSFTSNGTIAIGDQSTDPGLDSTMRIVTVDLVCP